MKHDLAALLLDHVPLRRRAARNVPFRCVSITASKSSSLILKSRLSRMIPAHVTRMSSEPPSSTAAATAASTSAREVTSQRTARPPIAGRRLGGSSLVEVGDHDARALGREA